MHGEAADWRPVARQRAHELVLTQVWEHLASGRLRRGDRLPGERDLAESMEVGRGAVREALRVLEALGVSEASVGSSASSGTRVNASLETGLSSAVEFHAALGSFTTDEANDVLDRLAAAPGNALAEALCAALRGGAPVDGRPISPAARFARGRRAS